VTTESSSGSQLAIGHRSNTLDALSRALAPLARNALTRIAGSITEITPSSIRVVGLSHFAQLGDTVFSADRPNEPLGEVVRLEAASLVVKSYESHRSGMFSRVWLSGPFEIRPSPAWRGRVVDALARPIDDAGPLISGEKSVSILRAPPPALQRQKPATALHSGVRVVDLFTPLCIGQRVGIFAGSGVGKSTLLGMLAQAGRFDCIIVALVGERSREIRDFVETSLGANRSRCITVAATGDESPMLRRMAPLTATTLAEYFRDQGQAVLLVVDSVTRYAHACREIAMASGEPPVARGYTPSVFTELPRLLERAGPGLEGSGSITGLFTVLVDGDDHNDPVADAIRGILDGHIVLDRAIADSGRLPAVDPLKSLSRLADRVLTPEQLILVQLIRKLISRYEETRELRLLGGYQAGLDTEIDKAVALVPRLYEFISQRPTDPTCKDVFADLLAILNPAAT
jgi:flagellum-specific ATP synthase